MKMFRAVLVLALLTTLLPVSGLARNHTETWAAWVSDAACGAEHTKPGREDCVRKCKRGGASVGHPEWTAQPLVLVRESDKSVWKVENPQLLSGHEGRRVTVKVRPDAAKNSVKIESLQEAQE